MRAFTARRLLARSIAGGFQGRGWERLVKAGERGDRRVINTLWTSWLRDSSREEILGALTAWGHAASDGAGSRSRAVLGEDISDSVDSALLHAAVHAHEHPIGAIARDRLARLSVPDLLHEVCVTALQAREGRALTELLAARDDLPFPPMLLAELFLVARRQDRYKAQDPDGSLLVAAYQVAGRERRQAMRDAMVEAGEPDVVSIVVAGERTPILDVDVRRNIEVRENLAESLIDAGRWEQAWRMAKRVRPHAAARIARRLPEDWRPGGEDGPIHGILRGWPEHLLKQATEDLRAMTERRLPPSGPVVAGGFSPDGRLMVVVCAEEVDEFRSLVGRRTVLVIDAHTGDVLTGLQGGYGVFGDEFSEFPLLAMTTRGLAIAELKSSTSRHSPEPVWWLPYPELGPFTSLPLDHVVVLLSRVPDGLVAVVVTDGGEVRVLRLTEDGRLSPDGPLTSHELPFLDAVAADVDVDTGGVRWSFSVSADPLTGRIVFRWREGCAVADVRDGRVLADSRVRYDWTGGPRTTELLAPFVDGGCFTDDPDQLLTGSGLVQIADGGFTERSVLREPRVGGHSRAVFVPARREFVILLSNGGSLPGSVRYLDADTLDRVSGRRPGDWASCTTMWSSPRGGLYAFGDWDGVTVINADAGVAAELADRSLDALTARDLRAVTGMRRRRDGHPERLREIVDALHEIMMCTSLGTDDLQGRV